MNDTLLHARVRARSAAKARTSLLPLLFARGQTNGWEEGMQAVTAALLRRQSLPGGPWLDVGCGNGAQVTALGRTTGQTVWGIDRHPLALAHAVVRTAAGPAAEISPPPFVAADLHHLPWPNGAVGLILALDTIDQVGVDIDAALVEIRRLLREDGLLLLRVSAHPWLRGPHDDAFNTGVRYSRRALMATVTAAGFEVLDCTYANGLLGLPAALLRLLQRFNVAEFSPALYTNRGINRALRVALTLEARWLRGHGMPIGLSLYLCARKPVRD